MSDQVFIGIDLGTTFCSVAVFNPTTNKAEVIQFEGQETVPSQVAYTIPRCFGFQAQSQLNISPKLVAYDSKRMIGQTYDEVMEQNLSYPFKIECNSQNEVDIVLEDGGRVEVVTPVQVSAEILKYLKDNTEKKLGKKIDSAVITIPHAFTNAQRTATRNAAIAAGFNEKKVHFLQEPTAAAIKFAHSAPPDQRHHILIYDFGGGTFDISLATIENKKIDINSTAGDPKLGGQDIDAAIVDFLAPLIKQQTGIDIKAKGQEKFYNTVKFEAEKAKKNLSTDIPAYDFNLNFGSSTFAYKLLKARFRNIIEDIIEKTIKLTNEQILKTPDDKQIILVGGSSMIPMITEKIEELGLKVINETTPLTAVAQGAAYYHYITVTSKKSNKPKRPPHSNTVINSRPINFSQPILTPIEVEEPPTPLHNRVVSQPALLTEISIKEILTSTLGIADGAGRIIPICNKGEKLPCEGEKSFYNYGEGDAIGIDIYEGEGKTIDRCKLIYHIEFDIEEHSPPGSVRFTFKISVSKENFIKCTYKRTNGSGETKDFSIAKYRDADKQAVARAQRNIARIEDREKITIDYKNLENEAESKAKIIKTKFRTQRKSQQYKDAEKLEDWISENGPSNLAEYEKNYPELQRLLSEFIGKYQEFFN